MHHKRYIFGLVLILGALLISGCDAALEVGVDVSEAAGRDVLRGSGHVVTEERTVADFDRVSLTGAGDVIITQGETEALTVETDDNLLPYIQTRVKHGTLTLGFTAAARNKNVRPTQGIIFHLSVKDLTALQLFGAGNIRAASLEADRLELHLSGAGDVQVDALTAQELEVRLSGAGNFRLAGQVTEQDVRLTGAGDYRAGELESQTATVQLSGVGRATVWAADSLDTQITGVGEIQYYGDPDVIRGSSRLGRLVRRGNP
jgi:hypothetical protein